MSTISICIPIYYKESVETIKRCFSSLEDQTVLPKEVVCALDQPSSSEIEKALDEIERYSKLKIVRCYTERGQGLGAVLNTAILNCKGEYIARMDVDDIAVPDRLEKEMNYLNEHSDVDVVGSCIAEFEEDIKHIIAYRNVPAQDDECKKMLKRRDPINHMTAMYRKRSIEKAGNYSIEMKSCEDTYLWTSFYEHNLNFANIQENLVYVHAGREMYERRGGKKAFNYVKKAINYKHKVGIIGKGEKIFQIISNYLILVLLPNSVRGFIYERILRQKK